MSNRRDKTFADYLLETYQKTGLTRRRFLKRVGMQIIGIALAFAGLACGEQFSREQFNRLLGDFGIPLETQPIAGPNDDCYWVSFSPVNDQAAFVSGMIDKNRLYVRQAGQPESFDLLWEPTTDSCVIKACAWSPDGKEIAFIAQAVNAHATPKSGRISIYVIDVASKEVREPVVIGEAVGEEERRFANVSYKKGLAWYGDSFLCVPDNAGGILKFDTHTGASEVLVPAQSGTTITSIALTRSGELRFIRARKMGPNKGIEFVVGGLGQDGTLRDYGNLTQQLGQIFFTRLSQDGDFVFVEKRDTTVTGSPPSANLIYKIETRSVISEIPAIVNHQGNMYMYIPMDVQNDKELILLESVSLAVDEGNSTRNSVMRIAKMSNLPQKQYKMLED